MEGDLQGGSNHVAALHVKTEAVDENASALLLGRQESPAPCGDTACRGGGGEQTAEELADTELQAATTTTPVLLCECSPEMIYGHSASFICFLFCFVFLMATQNLLLFSRLCSFYLLCHQTLLAQSGSSAHLGMEKHT